MPCSITQDEKDYYEREKNRKEYGVAELTHRITTAVACELAKLIEDQGLQGRLSPMAQKWIRLHAEEDAARRSV